MCFRFVFITGAAIFESDLFVRARQLVKDCIFDDTAGTFAVFDPAMKQSTRAHEFSRRMDEIQTFLASLSDHVSEEELEKEEKEKEEKEKDEQADGDVLRCMRDADQVDDDSRSIPFPPSGLGLVGCAGGLAFDALVCGTTGGESPPTPPAAPVSLLRVQARMRRAVRKVANAPETGKRKKNLEKALERLRQQAKVIQTIQGRPLGERRRRAALLLVLWLICTLNKAVASSQPSTNTRTPARPVLVPDGDDDGDDDDDWGGDAIRDGSDDDDGDEEDVDEEGVHVSNADARAQDKNQTARAICSALCRSMCSVLAVKVPRLEADRSPSRPSFLVVPIPDTSTHVRLDSDIWPALFGRLAVGRTGGKERLPAQRVWGSLSAEAKLGRVFTSKFIKRLTNNHVAPEHKRTPNLLPSGLSLVASAGSVAVTTVKGVKAVSAPRDLSKAVRKAADEQGLLPTFFQASGKVSKARLQPGVATPAGDYTKRLDWSVVLPVCRGWLTGGFEPVLRPSLEAMLNPDDPVLARERLGEPQDPQRVDATLNHLSTTRRASSVIVARAARARYLDWRTQWEASPADCGPPPGPNSGPRRSNRLLVMRTQAASRASPAPTELVSSVSKEYARDNLSTALFLLGQLKARFGLIGAAGDPGENKLCGLSHFKGSDTTGPFLTFGTCVCVCDGCVCVCVRVCDVCV